MSVAPNVLRHPTVRMQDGEVLNNTETAEDVNF